MKPIYKDKICEEVDGGFLWKRCLVYSHGAIRTMYERIVRIDDIGKWSPPPDPEGTRSDPPETLHEQILRRRLDKMERIMWDVVTTGRYQEWPDHH